MVLLGVAILLLCVNSFIFDFRVRTLETKVKVLENLARINK